MSDGKLEELAKLIKERKQDTPYTVLLGSGLSMTPDLLKDLDCPDWDAFDEKMKGKSVDEQYSLLYQPLNNLPLQVGYRCLAELLKASYFNILLTANIDHHLEDALEAVRLSSSERDFLVHGDQSDENIVKALERQQPRIKICLLCGRIRGRIFPNVLEKIESNSQLAKELEEHYLARDSIVLGFNDRDFDINHCIPTGGGSLWYITPVSTPDQIKHLQRNRGGKTITGDVADFNRFFCTLSTALGLQQHDIVGEFNGSAPPHPTGAINRAPTHSASLSSSFVDNSPTISEPVGTPQKTHVERFDSLRSQEEVRMSSPSSSSEMEEIEQEINGVQKLIRVTKRNIGIVEEDISQQGSSNVDLKFRKANLEEDLEKHQNRLNELMARKKELPIDLLPQVPVKIIEETPIVSQQQPHDENNNPTTLPTFYGTGKHWAVVVGVSEYEKGSPYSQLEAYNQLETCDKDAELLYDQLVVRSFHPSRLVLLTEHTIPLPNHEAILSRLQSTARKTGPDDLLLFYYSGFVDEDDNDGYLVARDSLPQELQRTATPMQQVKKIMLTAPAHAKILILDICHARVATSFEAQKEHIDRFISRIRERAEGVTILAAYKQQHPNSQNSVFVSLLKDTFAKFDSRTHNGVVTLQDIYQSLVSNDKPLLVSTTVTESIILYRHYYQGPNSYLFSAYLYVVKAYKTLEDVQTGLKVSAINESLCKRLLKVLDQVGDPPQPETDFPTSNEATLIDRVSVVHEYAGRVFDSIADMRYVCKNSPGSAEIEKKHTAILSELAKVLSNTALITDQLRNTLIPVDIGASKGASQTTNPDPFPPGSTNITKEEQIASDMGRTRLDEAQNLNREQWQTLSDPVSYNTATIRRLLTEPLTDQELDALCFDNFNSVYNQFASGLDKQKKIQLLIEHCSRHNQFPHLLHLVKQINPEKYSDIIVD